MHFNFLVLHNVIRQLTCDLFHKFSKKQGQRKCNYQKKVVQNLVDQPKCKGILGKRMA